MAAGAWFAFVQIGLDVELRQFNIGWAAVNNATYGFAVAFAKRGNGEDLTKSITGHDACSFLMKMNNGIVSGL